MSGTELNQLQETLIAVKGLIKPSPQPNTPSVNAIEHILRVTKRLENIPPNLQQRFSQPLDAITAYLKKATSVDEIRLQDLSCWALRFSAMVNNTARSVETLIPLLSSEPAPEPIGRIGLRFQRETHIDENFSLIFAANGFEEHWHTSDESLMADIQKNHTDMLVLDISSSTPNFQQLKHIREIAPHLPIIVACQDNCEEHLSALRFGATTIINKPLLMIDLLSKIYQLMNMKKAFQLLLIGHNTRFNPLFAQHHIETHLFTSIPSALAYLKHASPDICMIEGDMGDIKGYEIAQLLRLDKQQCEMPVILLTQAEEAHHNAIEHAGIGIDAMDPLYQDEDLITLVQQRAKHYRQIKQKNAFYRKIDPITGLLRRHYFSQHLGIIGDNATEKGKIHAVLFIEVDGYRYLIQSLDQSNLDGLRSHVAHTIQAHLEPSDFACSYSDRQFCLTIVHSDTDKIIETAEQIRLSVRASPFYVGEEIVNLSVSIGISKLEAHPEEAIGDAIKTCIKAQNKGGNRLCRTERFTEKAMTNQYKQHWADQIKLGLQEDRFFLVFQPISSLSDDQTPRYEVLLRFKNADNETSSPAQFMPIAAEENLVPHIDQWVIEKVLQKLGNLEKNHEQVLLFVKLSKATIEEAGFGEWLINKINLYLIDARSLVFELSEEDVISSQYALQTLLPYFRQLSLKFSIEHFGRSQKSLKILETYPVDYLKLDQSITYGLAEDINKQNFIREISGKIDTQQTHILAPFVESSNTLMTLLQLGVTYIQGDFLQQPDEELSYDFSMEL